VHAPPHPRSAINATARQLGAVLATAVTVVILGQAATTGSTQRKQAGHVAVP
jgi:hypothetical protein